MFHVAVIESRNPFVYVVRLAYSFSTLTHTLTQLLVDVERKNKLNREAHIMAIYSVFLTKRKKKIL